MTYMKKSLFLTLALLSSAIASAQNYDALSCFIKKYDNTHKLPDFVNQKMPEFIFNEDLNSKALDGKFVVVDFWATWCHPCRLMLHDIDSLLIDTNNDIQFIGIDAGERSAEKAHKYWIDSKFKFPMVDGTLADSCCASVKGGHPTALLIDDKGIIRARWDSYGQKVAGFIGTAIWVLKTVTEKQIKMDIETAVNLFEKEDWIKALYVLEQLPEVDKTKLMKLECLYNMKDFPVLDQKNYQANQYLEKLKISYAGNPEILAALKKLADKYGK